MIRKTIFAFVGIILFFTLAAVLAKPFLNDGTTTAPKKKKAIQPTVKPWNGQASRQVDSQFFRGGDGIAIQSIDFTGLDTAASDIVVHAVVTPGSSGKPKWLVGSDSFQLRSDKQKVWRSKVKIQRNGADYVTTIRFKGVPTSVLGDTCEAKTTSRVGLFTYSPTGVFVVQVMPPDAPPGHCFAKVPIGKIVHGKMLSRHDKALDVRSATAAAGLPVDWTKVVVAKKARKKKK